ncbi:DUF1254 domain-containing protein [Tabrizicola sp. BL-A-41-H6]|uniref:DUF1254 domain-containing protein n=1 Tax=Tabrizicola sp. BL-A-41-H6 TaxID=3421107 RepID=UPI003D665345
MLIRKVGIIASLIAVLVAGSAAAETQRVNAATFIRAESDTYMRNLAAQAGGLGKFLHYRTPTPLDQQTVIRMNLDTLYSSAVFDLAAGPVTVTMPKVADGRYVAVQVINQDHLTPMVLHEGTQTLTEDIVGTRYVVLLARVFVNAADTEDLPRANAVQDALSATQAGTGTLELPDWDKTTLSAARKALLDLGALGTVGLGVQMGKKGEVDPVAHLIATAVGWGLNPPNEAVYLFPSLTTNDGKIVHKLTMKDIPVDGFWSISVYNKDGFFEPNDLNVNAVNNLTGKKADDGSITVQFGGCSAKGPDNCIPITEGWNYAVRLYRPRAEVVNQTWKLPDAEPIQ